MWIVASIFIVSAFIAGKSWERSIRNKLIKKAWVHWQKTMDIEVQKKVQELLKDNEPMPSKLITEIAEVKLKEDEEYWKKKNARLESNEEYEKNQPEEWKIRQPEKVSEEAFMLWSLLTNKYIMERSLQMDGQIQTVCQRIVSYLLPHELDVLFQIDREVCNEAKELSQTFDRLAEREADNEDIDNNE